MKKSASNFKDKNALIEFLKSIAVSLASSGLDFVITALFMYACCHKNYSSFVDVFYASTENTPTSIYTTANVIGFVIGVLVNYLLSALFVFKNGHVGKTKSGFLKFLLFAIIGLGLTSLGCYIGYDVLGGNPWITKIAVNCIVFVYNFLTRRFFIFNVNLIRDDENTINL